MNRKKTILEKTMLGLVSGAASLALVSCTTPSSTAAGEPASEVGKCYNVKCGGKCGKGKCGAGKCGAGKCGGDKAKDKGAKCGGDKAKDKGAGCGSECGGDKAKDKGAKCGGDKAKDKGAGCGSECGGDKAKDKKDDKGYRMMIKEDCEKKGGRWEAK